MLRTNINIDQPVTIRIGELELHIVRLGPQTIRIGVDAPRHLTIDMSPRDKKPRQLIDEAIEQTTTRGITDQ